MTVDFKDILEAVKDARKKAKKRNFTQSFELFVNLKDVDLKRIKDKVRGSVTLPHEFKKPLKYAVIADGELATQAKNLGLDVLDKSDIEILGGDKKKLKRIANKYNGFITRVDLMPTVAKNMGQVLGPRGKMPTPVPPNAKLDQVLSNASKTVKFRLKNSPTITVRVGDELMSDEEIAENIRAFLNAVVEKLDKGWRNIKSAYVKLSMGPAIPIQISKNK